MNLGWLQSVSPISFTLKSNEIIYHRLFSSIPRQWAAATAKAKLDHFWFHSKNSILMPTICNVSSCKRVCVCLDVVHLLRKEYKKRNAVIKTMERPYELTWTWKPVAHLKTSLVCCTHIHTLWLSFNEFFIQCNLVLCAYFPLSSHPSSSVCRLHCVVGVLNAHGSIHMLFFCLCQI